MEICYSELNPLLQAELPYATMPIHLSVCVKKNRIDFGNRPSCDRSANIESIDINMQINNY